MTDKLKSRKLWLAFVTIAGLVLSEQYDQAVHVVLAYIGGQSIVDVMAARNGNKTKGKK